MTTSPEGSSSVESLNYYNYFTEVEEEFVRRRGKSLLISPMDWALIESWRNAGIPLHVVLRGINQAFDHFDAHPGRKKVNSLLYCEQAVESLYFEYRQSQVGAPAETKEKPTGKGRLQDESFSREAVLAFISRCKNQLMDTRQHLADNHFGNAVIAVERAVGRLNEIENELAHASRIDPESIERDLDSLDRLIYDAIEDSLPASEKTAVRNEAKKQLRAYKKNMDKEVYERTVENFVSRRYREIRRVPRLSLFHM